MCYKMCHMATFTDWLEAELRERKMSPADLARAAHKSTAVISRVITGSRKPSPGTLKAIAHGLYLPEETVFRAAGVLSPKLPEDAETEYFSYKYNKLPRHLREQVSSYLTHVSDRYKERESILSETEKPG